jgi:hypothetical protein
LSKILETGLWPYIGIGIPTIINNQLRESQAARGILAGQALLYDTIVIPTMDFGILPAILHWLSLPMLREAVDDGSIRLIRFPKIVGYGGNGAGIILNLAFGKGSSSEWEWWHTTMYGDTADALNLQLKHGCEGVPDWERAALFNAVMASCVEFAISDDLNRQIATETYRDIVDDHLLKNEIGRFYGFRTVELNRLPGPAANQLRFFNANQIASLTAEPKDDIDLTLIVAHLNLQIAMSNSVEGCDLSTFDGAARILKRKLERAGVRRKADPSFSRLLQIPGVPNVPIAVADGRLDLRTVWSARHSANARRFREWLAKANTNDGAELARLYVDTLSHEPIISCLPIRMLRWAVIAAAGAIASRVIGLPGEIAGVAAAGVDSLFVEKWLSGYSPALFLDELKRIRIQPPTLT